MSNASPSQAHKLWHKRSYASTRVSLGLNSSLKSKSDDGNHFSSIAPLTKPSYSDVMHFNQIVSDMSQ